MGNGRTEGRKLVGFYRTYNNRLIYVEDCVIISQGVCANFLFTRPTSRIPTRNQSKRELNH